MGSKIAIFDWGGETIHSYYLVEQLNKAGIDIDLYLFIPYRRIPYFNLGTFFPNGINENIRIFRINGTALEEKIGKVFSITQLLSHPFPSTYLNWSLPAKTRRIFKSADYRQIISVSIYSLYWVYKSEPEALKKLLHYSLEIDKITDPHVRKYWKLHALIRIEARLLSRIQGLIIQDEMRLAALLNGASHAHLRVFFLPVSIPGGRLATKGSYLQEEFAIDPQKKIILYFGAVYQERKIAELIDAFVAINNPDWVLVLHGGNVNFPDTRAACNIQVSDEKIPYHELYKLFGSATIGIALYDNSWPNTRLTAFSSEKVARYLQAGVPFIAFANESYDKLKREFDCCELIQDIAGLNRAIGTILENYSYYRENSFRAFNKYYNIAQTVQPLAAFLGGR